MSSSFEKLKQNLEDSLDRVLGGQYALDDVSEHVRKLRAGDYGEKNFAKYMVFQVELEEKDGETYSGTYLRGFEKKYESTLSIVASFLKDELNPLLGEFPDLVREWQAELSTRGRLKDEYNLKHEGLELTFKVLGGGRYDFKDDNINLSGLSASFHLGHPSDEVLDDMFPLLFKKEPYSSFKGYNVAR